MSICTNYAYKTTIPVQVLYPLRIDVTVEDDPVPLAALTTHVIDDLAKSVRKETVIPFTRRRIQSPVERVFVHGFGVDHVRNTFDTIETLKRREQHLPCVALPATRRTNHHEAVLDLLDLVELEDLVGPALALDETAL